MTAPQQNPTPSLFASLWYYRWVALAIVLGVAVLSGGAGLLTRGPASATATMALKSPSADNVLAPGIVGDASTTRFVEQRAQFATNDDVLGEVASGIDGTTISELRERISASPLSGTNIITITAEADTPDVAVELANATVEAYRTETAELADELRRQASDELAASQEALRGAIGNRTDALAQAAATTLADLQRQGAELRVNSLLYGDGVDFVNAARIDDATVPGPPLREIAVGIVLGLAIAAAVTWVLSDRRRRITGANAPVPILNAPLLGVIPRAAAGTALLSRIGVESDPDSTPILHAPLPHYQLVGAALMRRSLPGIVAVLGPPGGIDRSDAALSVAVTIAVDGGNVLVIDADPARELSSRMLAHRITRADRPSPGKKPEIDPSLPVRVQIGAEAQLEVQTLGDPGTVGSGVEARTFAERVWADHEKYDIIIIDTPSIAATPLVAALIRISTGILAVVPRGCDEQSVTDIRRTSEIYSVPMIGYVYTQARGVA